MMPLSRFSLLLGPIAAIALAPAAAGPLLSRHWGSTFISPMGEPFHDRGGDALADWFNQADTNHDGQVTLAEMQGDSDRFFARLDANHDGQIDPDEVDRYETTVLPSEGGDPGRLGLFGLPEPVAASDTNLDRSVSRAEFHAAARRRFAALDLGHKGVLTLAVLETVRPAPPAKEHEQRQVGLEPPQD